MDRLTSAGPPSLGDLIYNVSATLPDPIAGETLNDLGGRGVSHNVFDFLKVMSVKLKCRDRSKDLTSVMDAKVMLRRKLRLILGFILSVLRRRGDTLQ